jgi:hypothetical protein
MENITIGTRERIILKYLEVLKDLKLILDNTAYLSMHKFTKQHNVSKNLGTVLQKGGIIRLISKGQTSKWEWIGIEPNKYMAEKTLQELNAINNGHREQNKKQKTSVGKRMIDKQDQTKQQVVDYYEIKMFFRLITLKIKPYFKDEPAENSVKTVHSLFARPELINLNEDKRTLYLNLPAVFKTGEGMKIAEYHGIPERTFKMFLTNEDYFKSLAHGFWERKYVGQE